MSDLRTFKTSAVQPAFKLGELVREKSEFSRINRDKGVVTSYYNYNGEYRYLVTFDNGVERLLFERELMHETECVPLQKRSDAASSGGR